MSNLDTPIKMETTPATPHNRQGQGALWKVNGCTYLQRRTEADDGDEIEQKNSTYMVAAQTPHLAVKAFLRAAFMRCNRGESVVRLEVASVEWVSWVDASIEPDS